MDEGRGRARLCSLVSGLSGYGKEYSRLTLVRFRHYPGGCVTDAQIEDLSGENQLV